MMTKLQILPGMTHYPLSVANAATTGSPLKVIPAAVHATGGVLKVVLFRKVPVVGPKRAIATSSKMSVGI